MGINPEAAKERRFFHYMASQRELSHSQNFIHRPELVSDLLEVTSIGENDLVVEIGPGKGVITQQLTKRAGRVVAVERDPQFAEELSSLRKEGKLQLVIDDFLEWRLPDEEYKVFSNIPFNYTADIVNKLTSSTSLPTDIYLIVQKEAAHRFAGEPYHKNSLTSILLGLDFSVRILREIDRQEFEPVPSVDVVFVHFDHYDESQLPRSLIPEEERQLFRDFVVYGYSQWAPTVLDAFSKIFTKRQRSIIVNTQKLEGLKPTELTLDQWIGLYKTFRTYVSAEKKERVRGSEEILRVQQEKIDKSYRTRE